MNLKPLILFDNTTGGPDFEPLSKIMSKDAEYVNSSKSIVAPLNRLSYQPKEGRQPDPLLTAQWTSSPTSHRLMDLIPS
jgi:hypothetical protein